MTITGDVDVNRLLARIPASRVTIEDTQAAARIEARLRTAEGRENADGRLYSLLSEKRDVLDEELVSLRAENERLRDALRHDREVCGREDGLCWKCRALDVLSEEPKP